MFSDFCHLLLQHLRLDENMMSLTTITLAFIFIHMILKDKLTYRLWVSFNISYKKRTKLFVNNGFLPERTNED